MFKLTAFAALIYLLVYGTCVGFCVYVIAHFVRKFW